MTRARRERGRSAPSGAGGTNRARASAQVRLRGKASHHHIPQRRSVRLGTPVRARAARSVASSWVTTLAKSTTASR
jgi:hypothetical protein